MGKFDRPEESRQKDAAVVVVNLRARTGLEQVDSYEREGPAPRRTVHADVPPVHDPEVGLEVVRVSVASLRLTNVVGDGGGAVEGFMSLEA